MNLNSNGLNSYTDYVHHVPCALLALLLGSRVQHCAMIMHFTHTGHAECRKWHSAKPLNKRGSERRNEGLLYSWLASWTAPLVVYGKHY